MTKYTFFWRENSPFAQWYYRDFSEKGIIFNTAEKYMMYHKALLFDDKDIAEKILKEIKPKKQKELGRLVKGYDDDLWIQNRERIVYNGNHAKFTQNLDLLEILLATRGTILVEASPSDKIWGVGLSEEDPLILNEKNWKGLNLLGKVLTKLRGDLDVK